MSEGIPRHVRREATGGGPVDPMDVERLRMAWRLDEAEAKLAKGAVTFSEMRDHLDRLSMRIDEATRPKPTPALRLAALLVTVAVLVGGWFWQLARYPDRVEFNEVRKEQSVTNRALEDGLHGIRQQQVRTQADIETIRGILDRQDVALRELVNRRR